MNRNFVVAIGAVAVITAAIIGFVLWDEARRSERLTDEAPAIGFVATPVAWDEGGDDGRQTGHTLTFAWVDAADRVHPQTMERITWYDEDKTYKVCYNPADASDWKLYPSEHVCGS